MLGRDKSVEQLCLNEVIDIVSSVKGYEQCGRKQTADITAVHYRANLSVYIKVSNVQWRSRLC